MHVGRQRIDHRSPTATDGSRVSPKAWVRYWTVGVVAAPVLAVVMAVRGEWAAVLVAGLVAIWSIRMVAVWRDKLHDGQEPPEAS